MGLESALKGLVENLPKSNGGSRSVDAMVSNHFYQTVDGSQYFKELKQILYYVKTKFPEEGWFITALENTIKWGHNDLGVVPPGQKGYHDVDEFYKE